MTIAATTPSGGTIATGLSGELIRLINTAVTARLTGKREASPHLVERLRGLERRARSCAAPQAVQILSSARRLLGDSVELHPLTLSYNSIAKGCSISITD